MRNIFYLLLVCCIFFSGCFSKQNNFKIEGELKNGNLKYIKLIQYTASGINNIDSTTINKKGKFNLSGSTNAPAYYVLANEHNQYINLIISRGYK